MNRRHFNIFIATTCLLCTAATLGAEPASPIKVACIGDSITYGAGVKNRAKNCYPTQLGTLLGESHVVKNFGVNAATLLKKGDKPYWKLNKYKQALDFKPNIVIIKLGTNDSKPQNWKHKDEYVADYVELIQSFQKLDSKPTVWICYPAPAYPGRWGITDKVMKEEVMPRIDQVAKQTNVKIIDLYSALSDKKALFPDSVHPNAEGAKLMAKTIAGTISPSVESDAN